MDIASRAYYNLIFNDNLEQSAVEAFVNVIGGSLNTAVVLDIWGDKSGIHHRMSVPNTHTHLIDQLRTHTGGLHIEEDEGLPLADFTFAQELGFKPDYIPLRVPTIDAASATILASMQPVGQGEVVTIQWVISPTRRRPPAPKGKIATYKLGDVKGGGDLGTEALAGAWTAGNRASNAIVSGLARRVEEDDKTKQEFVREKWKGHMFKAMCRIGVRTPNGNGNILFERVLNALQSTSPEVNFLDRSLWSPERVIEWLQFGGIPSYNWPCFLNSSELAALLAFPINSPKVYGIRLGGSYQAPPSPDTPVEGRVVAHSTYDQNRPLAIPIQETLRHLYTVGSTGSGKTTLLENLVVQDMQRGAGLVYIDPKGDSAERLLDRIPPGREHDVIYFDPANTSRVVGLNLFAGSNNNPELAADNFIGLFKKLYKDSWGPRMESYFITAVNTLTPIPNVTLLDVGELLTNKSFRSAVLAKYPVNYQLQSAWDQYERLKDDKQEERIQPVLNKLAQFALRPSIRHVVGQVSPALNMPEVLSTNKIVIANLSKGNLGEETSSLLGSILMLALWQAVQKRSIPERARPFYCYVDECQSFLNMPTPLGDILGQARGYGFGLTLANQHLGQLDDEMQKDVLANCNSAVYFRLSANDAGIITKQYPGFEKEHFTNLGQYEVIAAISTGGDMRPKPSVGKTMPEAASTGTVSTVYEYSFQHYARDCAEIDQEINARRESYNKRPKVGMQPDDEDDDDNKSDS